MAQPNPNHANGILKNAAIAVSLKYLSNLWRSMPLMPLINCKLALKLKWTKYCVFSAGGTENDINDNDNANNIIFTIKDTKLYVPVVTLSARDNQKLSKLLKMSIKEKVGIKIQQMNIGIFSNQTLLESIDYLF